MTYSGHKNNRHLGKPIRIAFGDKPQKSQTKKKSAAEYHLQAACVKWFDLAYPEYRFKFFHIPNQSIVNNAKAGWFLKRMGRRAGVFDCLLAVKKGFRCGIFMDFKSQRGVLSKPQARFVKEMKDEGYECLEIESLDQFISVVTSYLGASERLMKNTGPIQKDYHGCAKK